ncbi:MAG: DMT family transporter [Loktanella sp.]|jgi:drug/metabolite transporter (DMT)-like permease|nr:DMT family transporter [Loktanella sp.]MDO7606530.1 DMT family transporter [Loktanella sp.]MDO7622248.1 DMT family transporter [Loktanella sp.]MDO7624783.1 DMT family transporter [Loktanella sp.]MDO7665040.1 DMT family transporter [Loktanella sp.]
MQQPTLQNWLSVLALGLIWGGTFMVVSIALRGYGPLTVACARTTLGAIALLSLMRVMNRPLPNFDARMFKYLFVIGILNTAVPFALLSWGQQYVASAFAGISMAALPLFVLPLAHIFTDEKLSTRNMIGVGLGFTGAVVLIGPSVLKIGSGMAPLGQIACIMATISYAISSIMTRRCPPIDSITMAALLLLVGATALIPAMLIFEGIPQIADRTSTIAIIFLGFVPTAFAALLRVTTIRSAGAVFMTLVNYQVPVWSMIFGTVVLAEVLPLRFFAALALIMIGLLISQWNSLKRIFGRG